jgi:hypothetical protein
MGTSTTEGLPLRTSEIHAKLLDRLRAERNKYVLGSLSTIESGDDAAFVLGNRIGKRVGMDFLIEHVVDFFLNAEKKDESL